MSKKLRVGIVGCGEATQILHIPALLDLSEIFEVSALCDASPTVLAGVGARLPEARRHVEALDLVRDEAVDVVLIANPNVYHADVALAAMAESKRVMIEKPMCMTLEQADLLAEAEVRHNAIVQIGYMRRHAPAFEEAVRLVETLGDSITLARVHDVIGPNASFIESTTPVIKGNDVPASILDAAKARQAQIFKEAIGTTEGARAVAYQILLGLSSHDISAMRELIGMPSKVFYAQHRHGGRFISAAFDYGSYVCQFETGIDKIARFDGYLQVYAQEKVVRVDYDTPYIRHQPAVLTVTERNTPYGVKVSCDHQTREDAFVVEWRRFHADVLAGRNGKCTIADARKDLEIFRDMMAVMN